MKIYLVRHGETQWTREQKLQGRRDIPLNETGRAQIRRTGKKLSDVGIKVDVMLSSPLCRAQESAKIIAESIGYPQDGIVTEPLFIERDFGAGEGTVIEDLGHKFPDDSFADMESIEDTCRRAQQAIDKVVTVYAGKAVMVVAHGAILKALIAQISEGAIRYDDQTLRILPGSVFVLDYTGGRYRYREMTP